MMMALWSAAALGCTPTTAEEVVSVELPAIVVLGERHGKKRDLKNAAAVVEALSQGGRVTVALEAVTEAHQDVLDRLEAGQIRPGQVKDLTDWKETWGHPFRAYKPLLAVSGVDFVAAGPPLGPKPEDVEVQVPPEYDDKLREQALGHGMPEEAVPKFSAAMAWRDLRIAELAVQGWGGDGALVIVAGRGHVSEGLGITWQLARGLSEAPVAAALLAHGEACGDEDRYLD